jgi:thiol:disulfide interchange protein DsbD
MVFLVIGIGMAAPYVVLTAFPGLLKKLPKAGGWMIRLKQGLGFVMLGVTAYLIFLFPAKWHLPLVFFCVLVGLAFWLGFQVVNFSSPPGKKYGVRAAAVLVIALGGWLLHYSVKEHPAGEAEVVDFSLAGLKELHEQEKTVMVEFTADWCPNCKYVEKTVLDKTEFREKLKENNVTLMIADWTHYEPVITELLSELGSKSIPFTAIFPGKAPYRPILLRDIYTLDSALEALDMAN